NRARVEQCRHHLDGTRARHGLPCGLLSRPRSHRRLWNVVLGDAAQHLTEASSARCARTPHELALRYPGPVGYDCTLHLVDPASFDRFVAWFLDDAEAPAFAAAFDA